MLFLGEVGSVACLGLFEAVDGEASSGSESESESVSKSEKDRLGDFTTSRLPISILPNFKLPSGFFAPAVRGGLACNLITWS